MGTTEIKGLIVGLGNPGPKYHYTPHNFGFLALDALLGAPDGRWSRISSPVQDSDLWQSHGDYQKWLALKPLTYMNLSGQAVGPVARWYKLAPEQILVIQDELDLPLGALRFKKGGGAAGHKGILSIASALNSNAFFRLRIGIGRPLPGQDPASYVLRRFSESESANVEDVLNLATRALLTFCRHGPAAAMQEFHSPAPKQSGEADSEKVS